MNSRKWVSFLALLAALGGASLALAHTEVEKSVPADKSKVSAMQKLELHFKDTVQFTALTLQRGAQAASPVNPLPTHWASSFVIPVPALPAGEYVLEWKVATDDGHDAAGRIRFTVTATDSHAGHH
jgi:methionine-rich copper-binding protein CopC